MQQVGHEFDGQTAVGAEHLPREVAPDDALAVAESGNDLVDLLVAAADRTGRVRAARKDRAQQRLGLRLLLANLLEDALDAPDRVRRRFFAFREVSRVVRADHQDNGLGLIAVQLAVVEPPEDMLRAICGVAEVEGAKRTAREVLAPLRLAVGLPEVRNGIADEHHLRRAVGEHRLALDPLLLEALHPPAVRIGVLRHGRDRANVGQRHRRRHRHAHHHHALHRLTFHLKPSHLLTFTPSHLHTYILVYRGPSPPCGKVQSMFSIGHLILHVLQCRQLEKSICSLPSSRR